MKVTATPSNAQLNGFLGQDYAIRPVVGLVIGVVHCIFPTPEQAAGTSMDLKGDPLTFGILADDELVGVRGRDVGKNGGNSDGGGHCVVRVQAVLWEPRP